MSLSFKEAKTTEAETELEAPKAIETKNWLPGPGKPNASAKMKKGDLLTFFIDGDPPLYESNIYCADASAPTETEKTLYQILQPSTQTIRYHSGATPSQSDDVIIQSIVKRLTRDRNPVPSLKPNCIVKFDDQSFISVAVDKALNLKSKAFSIAVIKLIDVTNTAGDGLVGVKVNEKIRIDSEIRCPEWNDGFLDFGAFKPSSSIYVIIEIQSLVPSEKDLSVKSQGWAILRVFHHEDFANFGKFQLPLTKYDGAVPIDFLKLVGEKELGEAVATATKLKIIKSNKKGTSVVIRICDSKLKDELSSEV
ncbi:hypothetical protein HDU97_008766 [Phlyctochytrium planicorne]|nr:hypothetical protein HDU97_008766 [Phlyctochytrium planicorne]